MAEKSDFRDLCSVNCIFLPPLTVLLLGFCFSGFCQLPLLISRAEWANSDFRAFQRDVAGQGMNAVSRANSTEAAPSPSALINCFWGENTFSWTKTLCGRSVSITVGRRVKESMRPHVAINTKGRSVLTARCLYSCRIDGRVQWRKRNVGSQTFFKNYCSSKPCQGNCLRRFVNGYEMLSASK